MKPPTDFAITTFSLRLSLKKNVSLGGTPNERTPVQVCVHRTVEALYIYIPHAEKCKVDVFLL